MAGLFSGIIGSLIGAGIQATVGGIRISEDTSKALEVLRHGGVPVPPANWFSQSDSNSDERKNEQVYDKIGRRVSGAMQVLEIAKALKDVAYPQSQSTSAKGRTPQEEFARSKAIYESVEVDVPTGTSMAKIPFSNCSCKAQLERKNVHSTAMNNSGASSVVKDKMLHTENGKKAGNKTDPRKRDMIKADKLMISAKIEKDSKCYLSCGSSTITKQSQKLVKPQIKTGKSFSDEKCRMCQAPIKNIKKSSLLPCGHNVCHKCMQTSEKLLKCSKCGWKHS